ncbi:hypothetical protein HK405_001890, partial [Cladochytrium tenue]
MPAITATAPELAPAAVWDPRRPTRRRPHRRVLTCLPAFLSALVALVAALTFFIGAANAIDSEAAAEAFVASPLPQPVSTNAVPLQLPVRLRRRRPAVVLPLNAESADDDVAAAEVQQQPQDSDTPQRQPSSSSGSSANQQQSRPASPVIDTKLQSRPASPVIDTKAQSLPASPGKELAPQLSGSSSPSIRSERRPSIPDLKSKEASRPDSAQSSHPQIEPQPLPQSPAASQLQLATAPQRGTGRFANAVQRIGT